MIKPKVLVVMPAYNAARFLNESIPSILNQVEVDVSLFVIDDASTDKTYEIAKSYKEVTVMRNKTNMGNYYSVNLVMHTLKNQGLDWDYHVYHGADDISDLNRFSKQLKLFNKPETLAVGCGFKRVDFRTKKVISTNSKTNESMLIFKKEMFDLVGYRDSGRAGCDTEYKRRIQLAKPGCIGSLNEILLTAYLHDSNLTKKIPLGGTHRKRYVESFTRKHQQMKKDKNFYQDFTP